MERSYRSSLQQNKAENILSWSSWVIQNKKADYFIVCGNECTAILLLTLVWAFVCYAQNKAVQSIKNVLKDCSSAP